METPTSSIEIASGELKLPGVTLQGGDKFDAEHHLKTGAITERFLAIVRSQAKVQPLTRGNYLPFLNRNGHDFVGRGFTRAELIARGIIDESAPVAPKSPKTITKVAVPAEATGQVVEYRGFKIVQKKNGKFHLYDVVNDKGELARAKPFRKPDGAVEFIDGMLGSPDPATADTSAGEQQESAPDDRDLQREPGHEGEPGKVPPGGHEHGES